MNHEEDFGQNNQRTSIPEKTIQDQLEQEKEVTEEDALQEKDELELTSESMLQEYARMTPYLSEIEANS